jgi:hypothetical protein
VASQVVSGASQSFIYSCVIPKDPTVEASQVKNHTWLEVALQFDLFHQTTEVSVADLVNLTVTPALAKLSVKSEIHIIRSDPWEWKAAESWLEVRLAVTPTFSSAVVVSNITSSSSSSTTSEPAATVTTWRLEGLGPEREATVRLVNVVELDGVGRVGDQWVRANLVGTTNATSSSSSSSLVLSFANFNKSVSYDPGTWIVSLPFSSLAFLWFSLPPSSLSLSLVCVLPCG